ncbi:MAG: transposase [Candidatus Marinimicrobia bacterium]|nr:transposase [Candidatus Neomarinimicrobiota bacterium]
MEYDLLCYCIMPNHVHVIFTLSEGENSLAKTMFSIKRYTAGEANKTLNREGQFWQHESYDHIIKNEKVLSNIINYVINNPVDAGLVEKWQDWEYSYLKNLDLL